MRERVKFLNLRCVHPGFGLVWYGIVFRFFLMESVVGCGRERKSCEFKIAMFVVFGRIFRTECVFVFVCCLGRGLAVV